MLGSIISYFPEESYDKHFSIKAFLYIGSVYFHRSIIQPRIELLTLKQDHGVTLRLIVEFQDDDNEHV